MDEREKQQALELRDRNRELSSQLDRLLVDKFSEDALHDKSKIRYKEKIKAKDAKINSLETALERLREKARHIEGSMRHDAQQLAIDVAVLSTELHHAQVHGSLPEENSGLRAQLAQAIASADEMKRLQQAQNKEGIPMSGIDTGEPGVRPMPKMETGHGTSHADAIACLQKIFAKNHTGFGSDITDENIDPGNLQYGEVTYQGMQPLYSALDLRPGDVFYDLGCGVGKLVLYVALRGDAQRSVGLEVGQRRFLLAEGARCSLDEELDSLKKTGKSQPSSTEYKFMLADISRHRYLDPTVAVLTNLCMDMGVQSRTVNCLLRCPSFRRLVSITPLLHSRLKLVRSVMVSCTWAKVSAWQVYDVLPPQEPLARSFLTTPAVIKRCTSATALKRRGAPWQQALSSRVLCGLHLRSPGLNVVTGKARQKGHATSAGELGKFAAGGRKKFASDQAQHDFCEAERSAPELQLGACYGNRGGIGLSLGSLRCTAVLPCCTDSATLHHQADSRHHKIRLLLRRRSAHHLRAAHQGAGGAPGQEGRGEREADGPESADSAGAGPGSM
ncbi:unnamed protein product [Symbiodinium necroappetens]|uniref:Histone-lysine N-methyltransferase, H3 lysine-79 specific n=1 Tax=Symbiodinium necroappetens TaxID=1628268 RepID=A0A812M6J4_9DINO|nr:unnamed protein product [Symbiodinium necroappetens]